MTSPGAPVQLRGSNHVVRFYDAFSEVEQGRVGIVMEYLGGGSLEDLVKAGGCQDEGHLANMAAQMLKGIGFLHEHKQLHRDIKPANILMSCAGVVKLADFGIARQLESTLSLASTYCGTEVYMAPERFKIEATGYSYPSDIWSIGVTILEVAAGKYPFKARGPFDLFEEICSDKPPVDCLPPGKFSDDFIDFVTCMLRRNPLERQTATQLMDHPFIMRHAGCGYESMQDLSSTAGGRVQAEQFSSGWRSSEDLQKKQEQLLLTIVDNVVVSHFDMMKKYFPIPPLGLVRKASKARNQAGGRSMDGGTMRAVLENVALDGSEAPHRLSLPVEASGTAGTLLGGAAGVPASGRPPTAPGGAHRGSPADKLAGTAASHLRTTSSDAVPIPAGRRGGGEEPDGISTFEEPTAFGTQKAAGRTRSEDVHHGHSLSASGRGLVESSRSFRRTAMSNSSRKLSFRASQFPVVRPMGPVDVRTLCSQLTVQTSFVMDAFNRAIEQISQAVPTPSSTQPPLIAVTPVPATSPPAAVIDALDGIKKKYGSKWAHS